MKDSDGHNYFFAVPKTWKENNMLPPQSILNRLDVIEERLTYIERALEALLEWQEEWEDGEEEEEEVD